MLNHIVLMGRLCANPEFRITPSGVACASVTIAVERDFSKKKEVEFIPIVAWRATGKFLADYFAKGSMAVVSGRLQMREWTDRDGNDRISAEVVAENVYFADSKKGQNSDNTESIAKAPVDVQFEDLDGDEDLPF